MSDVKVKFGAEDENLNATLSDVKKNLKAVDVATGDVTKGFSVGFKEIALGAAAGALAVKAAGAVMNLAMDGARAVVNRFGDALDFGGRMADLSKSTGMGAESLTVLERAFENSGVGGDALASKIGKLQKFISASSESTSEQAQTLKKLGLSYEDLAGKTPVEQMKVFANALSNVPGSGEKAALAMKIFGGKTAEMVPFLMSFDKEMATAQEQVGDFAGVMGRSSGKFDDLGDNLAAIKSKTMELAAGFLEKALPALVGFSEKLGSVDAADWGGKLMEKILKVADILMGAFRNPQEAIELIGTALTAVAKSFGNFMLNGFLNVKNMAFPMFSAGLESVAVSFKNLLLQGVISYIEFFAEKWLALANMIGGPLADAAKRMISPLMEGLKMSATEYDADMQAAHKKIADDLANTMENTEESTVDFFGAKTELDKLLKGTAKLEEDGKKFREEFEKAAEQTEEIKNNFSLSGAIVLAMSNVSDVMNKGLDKAADKLAKDAAKAEASMREIKQIGEILKKRDEAPATKNFADKLKEARESLEKMDEIFKTKLSKLSIPDLAKKFNIDTTNKSTRELFDIIESRLKDFNKKRIELGIDESRTKEDWDKIIYGLKDEFDKTMQGDVKVNLDGKDTVKTVREELGKPIDIILKTKPNEGYTLMEDVKKAVEIIRDCVKLIEPKLPQRALT